MVLLQSYGQPEAVAAAGLLYTALVYWFLGLIGAAVLGPQTLRTISRQIRAWRSGAARAENGPDSGTRVDR